MPYPAGTSQEYWRPSNPDTARVITSIRGRCWNCGADYTPSASFCHVCGGARAAQNAPAEPEASQDRNHIGWLGLSTPCLICFVVAMTFALAALMTGFIYKAETLTDWQAVQMWRLEWLVAAVVALLAGVLLKTKR